MATQELRRSQLVTTFGPGAMIDLPDESVIVAGLEHWHYDAARIPSIDEPRLVEKLKRTLERDTLTLRSPPPAAAARGQARRSWGASRVLSGDPTGGVNGCSVQRKRRFSLAQLVRPAQTQ